MKKSEALQTLSSYFHGVSADIDVVMVGRIPYLDIQYTDYKPAETVREEIGRLIPGAEWTRLERQFSRKAVMEELWRMYREDIVMLVQEDEDIFRSTELSIYVQERMLKREFTDMQ